ncbi:pyridoxal phosphate-dependent decarboxylase family protein [Kibdelosporangium phytohabitans]|uniref:Pyridoxal-dependent decarboxylase n=1 Tax=Kibdelosporangium phytohabitans TaxID=860235 RepID=A0A0N9IK26_9PSEU|nr:aminotransferase class V-fold PLP-dependent enzyme [Kibdelosporangium phytohabitans]ALG15499.1 pyridoxal-dependent decarboxylase [Kibdelosporangium phytohabitans]
MPAEQVLADLHQMRAGDLPTHGGRTMAYVYDSGLAGIDELGAAAHALASSANGLDPTAFPSLLRMENEIVATAANLLGGGAGQVTSGGTESCMLAVLAARQARPDVDRPSIVFPVTAHAAFHKAAHYFNVRPIAVPVGDGFTADPEAMRAAIDDTTVLVVASAPSYAHGVVDPIAEIAAAAAEKGVRCHVDACIGGWVLPYFARLGVEVPLFDFRVDGVTSISVDLHKYAYCPKGASVLLHRDASLRRSQYFASAAWPGYTMLNSTMQSTRSGGPIAAAWAVLRHVGDDGYLDLARKTLAAVRRIGEGLHRAGLIVLGDPVSTLLSVTSADTDLFSLADRMRERGWYVQPQFAFQNSPANLHLTVTAANHGNEDLFLTDLAGAVADATPVEVDTRVLDGIDAATLTGEQFGELLASVDMSAGMAAVNTLLAAAPAGLRERLLVEFLGRLYTS